MEQEKRQQGITLIELMIALSILSILSAVALPGYQSMVKKSRRQIAQTQLLTLHMQQQNYFFNHREYASSTGLNVPDSDHYRFVVDTDNKSQYMLKAKAKTNQKEGNQCDVLSINQAMVRTPTECW